MLDGSTPTRPQGYNPGVKWGVWGEGAFGPGSPQGYTALCIYGRGLLERPSALEVVGPLCGANHLKAGRYH